VGNVIYALEAQSASSKLEEARQAGAEKTALYEYTLAQEHLSKAMSEASEASYGDAYELAQLADQFAEQATLRARIRMRAVSSEPTHESASSAAQSIPPANEAQK
jgi:coproporphyrinogen III oxidase-like Fe-S oxidoreductase